jgi:dynein heavy chain
MDALEEMLAKMKDAMSPDFRLFITAQPHPRFPLGLLQMSLKCTNEPPAGMQAGVLRSYSTIVDQDRLERIDSPQWRQLVYIMCFLHSVVQERRKFGPLGFCVPYEFNAGDLTACLLFVEVRAWLR